MERWRWLPHDLGSYYVTVNIPEFMLRVVEDGESAFTTRVVVGKPDKQTPIFSNEMQEIVFNPYWNVPNSIKTEEIRPFSRGRRMVRRRRLEHGRARASRPAHQCRRPRGRSFAESTGAASTFAASTSISRQDPDNVLGNVKFVFPNKHDVYMHDTPQKFSVRKSRARREPWLHARAEPGSARSCALEARIKDGAPAASHRPFRRATTSILRCGRRFRSTSPISPSRRTPTARCQPSPTFTATTPAWRRR